MTDYPPAHNSNEIAPSRLRPKNQKGKESSQLDISLIDRLTAKNSNQPLSQNSKQTYLGTVLQYNQFIFDRGLAVNEESIKMFFDSISHLAPATQNLKKFALLKVIKHQIGADSLIKRLAVEKVFAEKVANHKVDQTVSDDECLTEYQVQQLITAAKTNKTKLLIQFLFVTGCRVSEAIHLKLKDISTLNGMCKFRIVGKGRKERFIYAPEALVREIRREYASETFLFESPSKKPLHRVNVTNQIKKVGVKLGFKVSAHSLRHSRATDMLMNKGISLKAVSKHLGHSSVAVTANMYIHDSVNYHELFSRDLV